MACREPVPYGSISGTDPLDLDLSTAFDSLPLPSFDSDLFSDDLISAEGLMADLDDLDFSFNDFVLPSESNDFLVGDGSDPSSWQDPKVSDESGITSSSQGSGDRCSDGVGVLNSPSPETGSCSREFYGAGSTEDSAACTSGISGGKVLNSPSPDSAFCDGDPSGLLSYSPNSNNISSEGIADQGIKYEEVGNGCLAKRKKEKDDGNPNPRSSKARKSINLDHASSPYAADTGTEEDDKKKARLMRNRESAQLSRQRKKHYVEELEDKVRSLHSTITELNGRINFIMAENASLRQQLSGGGVCPPIPGICPPPPMVPMPYPWVPCASYAMKPQGSQVPLVPIPRLKPQQPKSAPKIKKSESKKGEIKTKKVASVSFLGLLFFILLLGGFVPFVNVRYGGNEGTVPSGLQLSNNRLHGHPEGRVFSVTGGVNGSDHGVEVGLCSGKSGFNKGGAESIHCRKGRSKGAESEVRQTQRGSPSSPGLERSVRVGNASEPLVASLYVPRNDKLIKIDGNLIIHSVLASERAMASSHAANEVKSDKETVSSAKEAWKTSLAIAGNMAPAVAVSQGGRNAERRPHMYRNPNERQKALTSGSEHTYKENSKSTAADGSLQQWFREGLAGPILASGMCTEVFQFDVSPASAKPGAIIPATSVSNISAEHPPDTANLRKRKNRRILYPPIPLAGSALNKTEENVRRTSKNESFQGNKTVSSMVVSVLVDPREAGDVDGDGVITSKSLSRIFVVVLLDSVKYVTYSCVLPIKGSSPHLAA